MVRQKFGGALRGVSVEQGLAGEAPGTPAMYVALAHLRFDTIESFQAAFAAHAPEIMGDIPRYTSIEPIVQISEVRIAG
jgi:uncharacterized protein (TIGR02118 family)